MEFKTLEEKFLADFEALERENEELKKENERLKDKLAFIEAKDGGFLSAGGTE